MSYAEHGPRIFLTSLPNTGMSMAYGDYINLSRKRSEGKLKLHDSCSDLRAWSLNSMESSQYFRELTEHVTPSGTIIPFNVIIDHIIGLTSKAQNELHTAKKELHKYKTLELTPSQQEQLQRFDKIHSKNDQRLPEQNPNEFRKSLLSNAIFDFNKSLPRLSPFAHLPINLRPYSPKSSGKSAAHNVSSSKSDTHGLCANVELQVMQDTCDVGMQVNKYPLLKVPFDSVRIISVPSDRSLEFDRSDSETSENVNKDLIIEKDSEIIVLKNDLCVKDVELEELEKVNKELRCLLEANEDNVNSLRERLKAFQDEIIEVEDLKEELRACNSQIRHLKDDLNKKDQTNYMQEQEIAKLQQYVDEVNTLRLQNQSLTNKVVQLEEKLDGAKTAIVELRFTLREEQKLKKEAQERSCSLADKEDEIQYLLMFIKQISAERDQQKKIEQSTSVDNLVEELKVAIQDKDIQLSEYEKRMASMQKDIKTFFGHLKKSLNNFDELNQMCDDSHSAAMIDVNDEPGGILYNMNVIMTRLQNYKMERLELLQRIQKLQGSVERKNQDYTGELRVRYNKSRLFPAQDRVNTNETGDEYSYNFIEDRHLLTSSKRRFSSDCEADQAFVDSSCEINIENSTDELESQIIDQVSCALQKIESLIEEFREYAESEQPELIKRVQNVEKVLNDIASVSNNNQNINSRKVLISEAYRELKEHRTDIEQNSNNVPVQLQETVLNIYKSIETILRDQLQEVSSAEARHLNEKHIDTLFHQYLKSCIDRTRGIFEGAQKKCSQMELVLNKQQQTVESNVREINGLKQIIERYKAENDKNRKELREVTSELRVKKESMLKFEGKIKLSEMKLSKLSKNCMHLKSLNKNLEDDRNHLEKELQLANDKLKKRIMELRSLKTAADINSNALKSEMSKMENSCLSLEYENDVLRAKISAANEKDETIESLKQSIEKQESVYSSILVECKETVAEKQSRILTLQTENEMLNRRLRDTERELTKKSEEIIILYQEKSKIDLIHTLQKDLVGLNKNGEKLKTHLSKLKRIYVNEQDKNKKLENELDIKLRQNETLENDVEYWKNNNSQFLKEAQQELVNESSNTRMRNLSNELYERVVKLSRMSNKTSEQYSLMNGQFEPNENTVETNLSSDVMILNRDQEICPSLSNDLHMTMYSRDEKIKELHSIIRQFEDERKEKQKEIDKLIHEIECKNTEIKSLKESQNWLIQEKSRLQDVRKNEIDGYQKTITLMKKNYNSSVHALSAKHNESIMRLEMRFQDTMNSEQNSFDSETHMQSLDKQQLAVHDLCDFHITENSVSVQTKVHADEKPERLNILIHENLKQQTQTNFANETEPKYTKVSCNDHAMQPFFGSNYEITIQPQNNNIYQPKHIRMSEAEKLNQISRDVKYPYNAMKTNNVVDQQRWNFISRCSLYLKCGNIHHYS